MYEYLKKKIFLHKHKKGQELTEADLFKMFRDEITEEISVFNLKNKNEEEEQ